MLSGGEDIIQKGRFSCLPYLCFLTDVLHTDRHGSLWFHPTQPIAVHGCLNPICLTPESLQKRTDLAQDLDESDAQIINTDIWTQWSKIC